MLTWLALLNLIRRSDRLAAVGHNIGNYHCALVLGSVATEWMIHGDTDFLHAENAVTIGQPWFVAALALYTVWFTGGVTGGVVWNRMVVKCKVGFAKKKKKAALLIWITSAAVTDLVFLIFSNLLFGAGWVREQEKRHVRRPFCQLTCN